jgi:hypothetical protein
MLVGSQVFGMQIGQCRTTTSKYCKGPCCRGCPALCALILSTGILLGCLLPASATSTLLPSFIGCSLACRSCGGCGNICNAGQQCRKGLCGKARPDMLADSADGIKSKLGHCLPMVVIGQGTAVFIRLATLPASNMRCVEMTCLYTHGPRDEGDESRVRGEESLLHTIHSTEYPAN